MAKVTVDPGVCGMKSAVEVSKKDRMQVSVTIETKCEMIKKMAEELAEINLRDVLKPPADSIIYQAAARAGLHPPCPVPMAVIKAIEVTAGLALPRPVSVVFEPEEG